MTEFKKIDTTIPEFLEEMPVTFLLNFKTSKYSKRSCRHMIGNVVPRAIQAFNEGGYNSTVICVDCLLEWVAAHQDEIGG